MKNLKMLFNIFLLFSSLLLGSAISRIIAKILVFQKGLNLFSPTIQGTEVISAQLARSKSYDMVEFFLFFVISLIIFGFFYFLYRNKKFSIQQGVFTGVSFFVFALAVNIATLFASYSVTQTLIFIVIWYLVVIFLSFKIPAKLASWQESKFAIANGILVGFYLSILLHKFSSSVALPLAVFAVVPVYFYIFSKYEFLKHPGFIFLLLVAFFPYNISVLFVLGAVVFCLVFLVRRNKIPVNLMSVFERMYPFLILFIFLYNPLFYLGSFDTVEEGFWAGWLERMLRGQTMYRDFAVYHPPLLPFGLYIFTKISSASLYTLRLYFHLLQIAGYFSIYALLQKLVKSKWIRFWVFVLIVAYGSSLVRNNIEIRLASGLLPLLFIYLYLNKKKNIFLFIAGAVSSLALFVSLETGISSIIALGVATLLILNKKEYLRIFFTVASGALFVILGVFGILYLSRSLPKFLEYVSFYARSFSAGYQNIALARPEGSTLIQWIQVNDFTSSSGFLWELIKYMLAGSLALALILKIKNKFGAREVLFSGIAVFGIVLARSALGRSDEYHIAFVWIVSLLLMGYLLQLLSSYSKIIPVIVLSFLILFVGRDAIETKLLQNQLIKFQSYANVSGQYPSYTTSRAKILTGLEINTKNTDDLVNFIDSNVNKNESIYVFPQAPEIYFLADRRNATSFDTPTVFFTPIYQQRTIDELKMNKPRLIIYNPNFSIGGISVTTLKEINSYIQNNFSKTGVFGDNIVMRPR